MEGNFRKTYNARNNASRERSDNGRRGSSSRFGGSSRDGGNMSRGRFGESSRGGRPSFGRDNKMLIPAESRDAERNHRISEVKRNIFGSEGRSEGNRSSFRSDSNRSSFRSDSNRSGFRSDGNRSDSNRSFVQVDKPIKIKLIDDKYMPIMKTKGSSGYDLFSHGDCTIKANSISVVNTGVLLEIPMEMEAQIRPRSGLMVKNNIIAMFGTIDSDFRGEVGVIIMNFGNEDYEIKDCDRIAQIVFAKINKVQFEKQHELCDTERGPCGFGSTGI